ncbi:MAG: glycoside hydrolase family 88/105 protein [Janthinobacterium lividum]
MWTGRFEAKVYSMPLPLLSMAFRFVNARRSRREGECAPMSLKLGRACCTVLSLALIVAPLWGQTRTLTNAEAKLAAGDEDNSDTQMASLSPAIQPAAIRAAMKKVADWQIAHSEEKFNQDWTYAPLYLGLLSASRTTGEARYYNAVLRAAERFNWKFWANREFFADDEAVGQAYAMLYLEDHSLRRIADMQATFDGLVARHDEPQKDLWWWCDALFMAPAGLAQMTSITGDHKYVDKMNAEWDLTTKHLFVPEDDLYLRDLSYVGKTEANGKQIFWGRGNGWVIAGAVNTLKALPKEDTSRAKFEMLLKRMSRRVAGLQQPDGLWHTGLLDQKAYPLPELSGSAFFTYAISWGINEGLLDRNQYGPVVEKAWAGMIAHVFADGRLGCIQPVGAAPGAFGATSSYVYGVGAFLLAGSEMDRYAARSTGKPNGKHRTSSSPR